MKGVTAKRHDGRRFKCFIVGIDNLNITLQYKYKKNSLNGKGYLLCLNRNRLMSVPYKHYKKIYLELRKQIDTGYVDYTSIPLFQKYWGGSGEQAVCAFK